jgi:2-(1,2-epoxy-1,2-dihydrophenyl)acetyl-CoA isomerase
LSMRGEEELGFRPTRRGRLVVTEPTLLEHVEGGVLQLTINRPERGNALDPPTAQSLLGVIERVSADPGDVRVVRLRSNGKHFCTGADLGGGGSRADGDRPATGHMVRHLAHGPHRLIAAVWHCPLPIIAELTGRSSGLGLHLALACDFTIAAASATFAEPFVQRGFNVDSGGSWLLPRFIGLTNAKRLVFTGEPLDATTAQQWGLVTEVVGDDEVETRASAIAERLAAGATLAIGTSKQLFHQNLETGLDEALRSEAAAVELTIRSDDFKEGMQAFAEKRQPEFRGR